MKKIIVLALAILLMAAPVWGAESAAFVKEKKGNIDVLKFSWTTDSSGDLTATQTSAAVNGIFIGAETDPSATAAPSDNYDIVVYNEQGRFVCGDTSTNTSSPNEDGVLADRDNTVAEFTYFKSNGVYCAVPSQGKITVDVLNAGNSKSGILRIYYLGDE